MPALRVQEGVRVSATTAVLAARSAGKVLVVDDSAVIRQAISKMLKVDFDVVVANDGEAGWDALAQAADIGVLITDIEMPRLDGYALICRVRASDDARIRELPIIVITGADDDETKTRAYACGATDFITKPLNLAQLQACTQAYMRFEQPLTGAEEPPQGLVGRRGFEEHGEARWRSDRKDGLTVLTIAIDKVRALYREHGDERMAEFVDHVMSVLRAELPPQGACFARLGGAEFGVLLAGAKSRGLPFGQQLVAALAAHPTRDGKVLSISVGVASAEEGAESFRGLWQLAEERLKRAVALGGNRVSASALSDTLGGAEELVLDDVAPPPAPEGDAEGAGEPLLVPEFVAEPLPPGAPESEGRRRDLVSLDRVLWCLADGREASVEPHLEAVTRDVVRLLEFLERRRALDLKAAIAALRGSLGREADF